MIDRFEKLTTGVTQIYKSIQKIKKYEMNTLGLKSTHVMCLYYLNIHPDGLTAADLCRMCSEDKAGISRILADLETLSFIRYDIPQDKKKYRAKAILTETGREQAQKVNALILHSTVEGGRGLTEEEREIFYRILFLISGNLARVCSELDT